MFDPCRVILHCAVTPDFPESHKNFDKFGAKEIDQWHRQRGFRKIGYHYVIRRSGVWEIGRSRLEVGAHAKGYNRTSIGVCLVGTLDFTIDQFETLVDLAAKIQQELGLSPYDWFGHYEFNKKKTCPNIPMNLLRDYLESHI